MQGPVFRDHGMFDDGVFDDGAARTPGSFDLRSPDSCAPDPCAPGAFEDVEVVDEFGLPVLPPEHTEAELARILATNPMDDPGIAAHAAPWERTGPDGLPGETLDPVDVLLEEVTRQAPDPIPAAALRDLTRPDRLDHLAEEELRHVVAGWERLISWARAGQASAARELFARTDGPLARDSVAGEITGELHVTTHEAWQIAMRGEGTGLYPQLADALAAGRIDAKKTDTFLRAGADLTPHERGEAIDDLLPVAPKRTWKWISEQLNARAAGLHGTKARRRDVTDRCNVWAEQVGPGRGRIVADLPVTDAALTFNAVQAAAKALKDTPGETRPLGALRAAAFTALVTGRLVLPCPDHDTDDQPGNKPGDEPDNDNHTDNHTDGAGDGEGMLVTPPSLVAPVLDTDLVPVPEDPDGVHLTGPATGPATSPVTSPAAGPAGTRLRVIDVPATVHVTVAATMLLDPADTTPGILDGIGPVPADDAARIAADGTWRRLLTDPVTGVLTDYSTRTYTPGSILRAAVGARDGTCRFPGCDRPATTGGRPATDLDHIEPFDKDHRCRPGEPGQTRATNLHPLCRKHHNLKTHATWQVTRDPDTGITRWTAPRGATIPVEPAIVDPVIRYARAHGLTIAQPPQDRSPEGQDIAAQDDRGDQRPPF
ncbi:HNH endonuclease signature motif containing protein [Myceligenerans pegani]|uniref:HNH endonuclease n=1 Tax=Myceligenerans pegani TaxID=2776917 RepID=A0ABR9MU55_9MICO|nr:HNH endonuclease signature motif containing protein [Myceligenerans sp. TRM 65318]MBE1874902.1 HNH endonuclease [Myceligenerans sp. TRM 65318]MBE3017173.1 HNH endonuclease [Myceligenerans sp. TRM 65318]